jgi:hypothetical protein
METTFAANANEHYKRIARLRSENASKRHEKIRNRVDELYNKERKRIDDVYSEVMNEYCISESTLKKILKQRTA